MWAECASRNPRGYLKRYQPVARAASSLIGWLIRATMTPVRVPRVLVTRDHSILLPAPRPRSLVAADAARIAAHSRVCSPVRARPPRRSARSRKIARDRSRFSSQQPAVPWRHAIASDRRTKRSRSLDPWRNYRSRWIIGRFRVQRSMFAARSVALFTRERVSARKSIELLGSTRPADRSRTRYWLKTTQGFYLPRSAVFRSAETIRVAWWWRRWRWWSATVSGRRSRMLGKRPPFRFYIGIDKSYDSYVKEDCRNRWWLARFRWCLISDRFLCFSYRPERLSRLTLLWRCCALRSPRRNGELIVEPNGRRR